MLGRGGLQVVFVSLAVGCCCVQSQTLVYSRSVVSAASYMQQGLPGGGIAQGSIFSIFGSGLGPTQGVSASSFPLNTTLSGTSITVSQGTTSVSVIPVYVSDGQINAIMPSNAPVGLDSLRVTSSSGRSNAVPVQVVISAFGIFSANSGGTGPGILQNYIAADNQPINAPAIAAKPGQTITLWGTGLGPVSYGDNIAPTPGDLPAKTEVFVGAQPAQVTYHGRTSCCSGTDQVDFVVPSNAPLGCWVPVYVRTNGTNISNFVTMAIQTNGTTCSDAINPLASTLVAGGNMGAIAVVRETTHEDIGTVAATDVATDFAVAGFSTLSTTPFPFHPALSLPPLGTCTEYTGHADLLNANFVGLAALPTGATLNAGTIMITGPPGASNLSAVLKGYPSALFGSSVGGSSVSGNLSLNPGKYTVQGGGTDLGSFSATLNVPQPITWTNRDQLTEVNRSQPLTISWSGAGPNDIVGVVGFGIDSPTNSGTVFACLAPPSASSLTVPADVLANLPATEQYVSNSTDVLYLVSVPQSAVAAISASGLDAGVALFAYVNGKTVIFQ